MSINGIRSMSHQQFNDEDCSNRRSWHLGIGRRRNLLPILMSKKSFLRLFSRNNDYLLQFEYRTEIAVAISREWK